TLRRASPDVVRRLSTLVLRPERDATKMAYVTPVLWLPPGSYEAVVSFDDPGLHEGEVSVVTGARQAVFGRTVGALSSPTRLRFDLPVQVQRLSVRITEGDAGAAVSRVEIVPLAVIPPPLREDTAVRQIESLTGPGGGGYLVYTDAHAYPEGAVFWTVGAEEARVLVAPQGASRIILTLFTGPLSGDGVGAGGGRVETVGVAAGETRKVEIKVPAGQRLVPLAVQSRSAFRPAEVEKSSRDTRLLGCQVRIHLE